MEQVVTNALMRESDRYTIEHFCDSKTLMYRAAKGIYNNVSWKGKIAIVCGKGNNGGDGFALSGILQDKGISTDIYLLEDKFSEDGAYYYQSAVSKGANVFTYHSDGVFTDYDIIVDCIFGTGFKGEPSGIFREAIKAINQSKAFVVSADINSGLNGDTGKAVLAVKSDITVAIGCIKVGELINDSSQYIKEIVRSDIGIKIIGESFYLADNQEITALLKDNPEEIKKDTDDYLRQHPEFQPNNSNIELFYINNTLYFLKQQ